MASKENSEQKKLACPHFSAAKKCCLLNKGGLFIPVADHIQIYCQTCNFRSCQQLLDYEAQLTKAEKDGDEKDTNRRRYERTPGRYYMRLSEYKPNEMMEVPIDDYASTIDLSPGGMRLESNLSLEPDTLISFYMDESFSIKNLRGVGKVRWCRSLTNTPLYHAGLDFIDQKTSNKIREHLGLSVS